LNTRVAVVSGGGTGIGRATAEVFAHAGHQVILVGRRGYVLQRTAKEIAAANPSAPQPHAMPADAADPDQVDRLRTDLTTRWPQIDVLVNAAGGNVVLNITDDDTTDGLHWAAKHWAENFRVNTLSAVLLTEALKDRLAAPGGRIILLSSIAAYRGSGSGSYAGAKAALHPYAFDLAAELGGRGITVNVVAPGYIAETEFFRGGPPEARRQLLISQTMNGRAGTPADIADTIHWLASPAAGHITAQVIQVNGGAERGR
jgi:3-oxoacyl-[acyl-carrier protein] reductase